MYSNHFVSLALNVLKCSQKDLASKLGVSSTQISKWKKGEHMSEDMENQFRVITGIEALSPRLVLWAGSVENAKKWSSLIGLLAENAKDNAETSYLTLPLDDEDGCLCDGTIEILENIGLLPPESFPDALDHYDPDDESGLFDNAIEENIYSSTIDQIYRSLNDVYGFFVAYVKETLFDNWDDVDDSCVINIEYGLLELAASKINIDLAIAPLFGQFRYRVQSEYETWLNEIKLRAFRSGLPLRAELLRMVYDSADSLGHDAEMEGMGSNKRRIHPDVYMNELLTGMRMIHQVLPVILKKLEITDFELDTTKLRAGE
ncbi:helix-turn-helix transcriptional regulator [Citrobacter freundii]|nr:helix-turn-helix transcriptional regulator [Citrobacter freundii]